MRSAEEIMEEVSKFEGGWDNVNEVYSKAILEVLLDIRDNMPHKLKVKED